MNLTVTVTRVLYPPAVVQDATWFVLLTEHGKCSGNMTWRPLEGERIRLDGRWSAYRGERQFQFQSAMPDVPVDPRAQLHYVCTRAVGIGQAMEERLWAQFGANWTAVQPGDIPRLTGGRYIAFRVAVDLLEAEAEKSEAITWLFSKGATMAMATAAWEQWGEQTIHIVQDDPFRLSDLPHYGFTHVDGNIREAFGIGDDDTRRLRAAVLYSIRRLTSNGSTVLEWTEIRQAAAHVVGWQYGEACVEVTREMFGDGSLIAFADSQSIALAEDYRAEQAIWEYVQHAA